MRRLSLPSILAVIFSVGCSRDQGDPDAGVGPANQANIVNLSNAISCKNLSSSDYSTHGCYCGPGNAYWTGGSGGAYDSCNPLGGVQLDGPAGDESDECCKDHDNCYYEAWKQNHLCNCGSYNPFDPTANYTQYDATCAGRVAPSDAGAGTPGSWTCGNQTGDTQEQIACRQACCSCDATIAACLRNNRSTFNADLGRTADNCPSPPPGSSGQQCLFESDCTYKPWPESWLCDGGAASSYELVCQEGWCYRTCGDGTVCPYPRLCVRGTCQEQEY